MTFARPLTIPQPQCCKGRRQWHDSRNILQLYLVTTTTTTKGGWGRGWHCRNQNRICHQGVTISVCKKSSQQDNTKMEQIGRINPTQNRNRKTEKTIRKQQKTQTTAAQVEGAARKGNTVGCIGCTHKRVRITRRRVGGGWKMGGGAKTSDESGEADGGGGVACK